MKEWVIELWLLSLISDHLYQEAKGWQAAIGSVLGFGALMLAALFNFYLNRRRDAALRNEESLSVAAALYGEILLLRKETSIIATSVAQVWVDVGTHRDPVSKFDSHFLEAHVLPEPILYKGLAPKLGLLEADMVVAITRFHSNFQSIRSNLPLLVDKKERGYNHSVLNVLIPARDAITDIVPTLRKIEGLLSLPKAAEDPDLKLAFSVIEDEEATFSN